jgi:TPR repeat protein
MDDPHYQYRDFAYQVRRGWIQTPRIAEEDAEDGDLHAQLYCASSTPDKLHWYRKAAAQGHPEGMANCATLYEFGINGAKKNLNTACEWMEKFLQCESIVRDPHSMRNILYRYGCFLIGDPSTSTRPMQRLPKERQDAARGLQYMERAAEEYGCLDASKKLSADLYMSGRHPEIPRDLDKVMYWYLKGAQNGDGESAWQLAVLFMSGMIPVHRGLKKKWLQIGDKLGHKDATRMLELSKNHKPLELKEARKRLRHLDKEKKIEKYLATDSKKTCSNKACSNIEGDERFNVCSKCRQTKYCSRECQVSHWRTAHKDDCSRLGRDKDEIKALNRNTAKLDARICFNPACEKPEKEDEEFQLCSGCKNTIYCSRECQKTHYSTEHKEVCKRVVYFLEEADKLLENVPERPPVLPGGYVKRGP